MVSRYGVSYEKDEDMEKEMENLDRWGFDAFRVDALTNHRPLTAVTFTVLQVSNFTLQKATTMNGMCVEYISLV